MESHRQSSYGPFHDASIASVGGIVATPEPRDRRPSSRSGTSCAAIGRNQKIWADGRSCEQTMPVLGGPRQQFFDVLEFQIWPFRPGPDCAGFRKPGRCIRVAARRRGDMVSARCVSTAAIAARAIFLQRLEGEEPACRRSSPPSVGGALAVQIRSNLRPFRRIAFDVLDARLDLPFVPRCVGTRRQDDRAVVFAEGLHLRRQLGIEPVGRRILLVLGRRCRSARLRVLPRLKLLPQVIPGTVSLDRCPVPQRCDFVSNLYACNESIL